MKINFNNAHGTNVLISCLHWYKNNLLLWLDKYNKKSYTMLDDDGTSVIVSVTDTLGSYVC